MNYLKDLIKKWNRLLANPYYFVAIAIVGAFFIFCLVVGLLHIFDV